MQSEIDNKQELEHDDLERAHTGKGEMVEERIELSEEDVSHLVRDAEGVAEYLGQKDQEEDR